MKDEQRQQTSAGKKKQNPQKLRNTIFVAAFVLLGLYYFYLRAQEQQEMQQVPGYATLATAAPAQEIPVPSSVPTTKPGASPSAANTASPTAMPKATPTAKPAAQKTEEEIPYVLAGENGQVRYDSNGNLIDTSNFLVSVKSPSQVLPRGFSVEDIPVFHGKAVLTVNGNVPFFTEALSITVILTPAADARSPLTVSAETLCPPTARSEAASVPSTPAVGSKPGMTA